MWIDDQVLAACEDPCCVRVWVPDATFVVLGSSNEESKEVYSDACRRAGVPILRRYGGGGTVVLHSGCVIASVGIWVDSYYKNDVYFREMNQAVIEALGFVSEALGGLCQRGISDICLGEKKIAGTSMFRSRNYLLYQASVLVDPRFDLIESLLPHPSKEPEYRKARKHSQFLAGLSHVDEALTVQRVAQVLQTHLSSRVLDRFRMHSLTPQRNQFSAILQRVLSHGSVEAS